jgi:hypothetical protein
MMMVVVVVVVVMMMMEGEGGAQIFQKFRIHFIILDTRNVT